MSHEVNPLFLFKEHTAAVKAVSWCPWQSNVLGIYTLLLILNKFNNNLLIISYWWWYS